MSTCHRETGRVRRGETGCPDVHTCMGRSPARPLSLVQRAVHMMVGATLMYALLMGLGMWRVEPRGRSRPFGSRSTPVIIPDLTSANGSVLSPHWSLDAIRAKTWKFQTPTPRRCSQATPGTHLTIDDVAFGILTSNRFVETRLRSQKNTWLRQVRHVVFYSESDIAWLPAVGLKPPPGEQLVGGGAWKNFPALMDLHQRFPHQKWIFFNDDDTYVFVRNLLRTLNNYDPNKDYYIGLYWTPRIDMEWKEVQLAYASGGAGYALSHHMMRRLAPLMPSCHGNYTRWAGDVRVGKCIVDLGVKITPELFHRQ
ncbi:hypothetical protein AB1Y20_017750 [Prymnesium parvum]|uniref:N-acetylgalactosaminide beta-1,3-galactosyltransferase n=1 Tax=Prymnesium parvum TaxID=97485 RepID=A0AB34JP08_PRYPA